MCVCVCVCVCVCPSQWLSGKCSSSHHCITLEIYFKAQLYKALSCTILSTLYLLADTVQQLK